MTSKITKGRVGRGPDGRWKGSKMKYADADDPIYSQGSVVGGQVLFPKGRRSSASKGSGSAVEKTPEEKEKLRKMNERLANQAAEGLKEQAQSGQPESRPARPRRSGKTEE